MTRRAILAGVTLAAINPLRGGAQEAPPRWVDGTSLLVANIGLGVAAVTIGRLVRGEPVLGGLVGGAVGGALSYSGRAVAGRSAAGGVGRALGAVGHSVIGNAIDARPLWSRLEVPVGPVWVTVPLGGDQGFAVELDVTTSVLLGWALVDGDIEVDWKQSLSRGAVVLEATHAFDDGGTVGAAVNGGFVAARALRSERLYRHETVHVVELDFLNAIGGRYLDSWIRRTLLGQNPPALRLSLTGPAVLLLGRLYFPRALEAEASYLAPYD